MHAGRGEQRQQAKVDLRVRADERLFHGVESVRAWLRQPSSPQRDRTFRFPRDVRHADDLNTPLDVSQRPAPSAAASGTLAMTRLFLSFLKRDVLLRYQGQGRSIARRYLIEGLRSRADLP
jgi:hypothetical protein